MIYLPPDQVLNNTQYTQIVPKTNGLGESNMNRITHFTRVASSDGWDHVMYFRYIGSPTDFNSPNNKEGGYVYILTNDVYPDLVKIGMTTNTPTQRAHEISRATGVAVPWVPVFEFRCYRSDLLEKEVHAYLKNHRVNNNREMFAVDSRTAEQVIRELGFKYSTATFGK